MTLFSYYSARVTCAKLAGGAVNFSFYGFLTCKGFDALYEPCRLYALGAAAVIVRFDTALLSDDGDYLTAASPGASGFEAVALVVPANRYDRALRLARTMAAEFGVRRPVFLPEQAGLAHQWAAHVARSQSCLLPLLQR